MTTQIISEFRENPFDIETFFDSLVLASRNDKEQIFIDMALTNLRHDKQIDVTHMCFAILQSLDIIGDSPLRKFLK